MPASTPEPNLVTNLFLIEDIMLTLENIKQENFQLLTNQVYCFFSYTTSIHWKLWFQIEQSLYKKCDNVSGVLIEDTKILMQFYTEKNQKLRKMISRMKSRNSSLGKNMLAGNFSHLEFVGCFSPGPGAAAARLCWGRGHCQCGSGGGQEKGPGGGQCGDHHGHGRH